MNHLRVLSWARWELVDAFDQRYKTVFTASVLKPSFEYPVACASMSVVKGRDRVFIRFMSLDELHQVFTVPEKYTERLQLAFREAERQAENIRSQQRSYHAMSKRPNSLIVDPESGEILAEAERIIKGDAK